MIAHKQLYRHRPDDAIWGDCHRTAIASMLNKQTPTDVPHFGDGGPDSEEFEKRVSEWLLTQNMVQVSIPFTGKLDEVLLTVAKNANGVHYLLGGESKTGVDHTVVCQGEKIVHDPSLDGSGIIGPCADGFYWITFLCHSAAL